MAAGQRIVPFIGYEDAAAAIEFLERAFGFRENRDARHEEDGTIGHAELELDGATIYLSTPPGYVNPHTLRAESESARRSYDNPWVIDGHYVEVGDADAHCERARAAGATILREPEEPASAPGSTRRSDLEGHRWMFGQPMPLA